MDAFLHAFDATCGSCRQYSLPQPKLRPHQQCGPPSHHHRPVASLLRVCATSQLFDGELFQSPGVIEWMSCASHDKLDLIELDGVTDD
eukprot:scaffold70251_cov23-Tisochrysis_lutea.AAC.2